MNDAEMTPSNIYLPRLIKRPRRSKSEIETLKAVIYATARAEQPLTIGHLFYRLVSAGAIEKAESVYKNTLIRLLGEMRLDRTIPFDWFVDPTRWMRKPRTYSSLTDFLLRLPQSYRRDRLLDQPVYVEVWCEKNAIASILYEVTAQYDVPLMVCVGFSSLTFVHESAERISGTDKPTYILYFGDWDPSGVSISQNVDRRLKEFSASEIHFRRLAITTDQILLEHLPTRPTKTTDSRSKTFLGESVEIDAMSASRLQEICRGAITSLIDPTVLSKIRATEQANQKSLEELIRFAIKSKLI